MRFPPVAFLFAASANAAILSTIDSTTPSPTSTSTTTTSSASYSPPPTPTPTRYVMNCGGSMGGLCGDVCFCGSGAMNCHADPSARCYQMCSCVAEIPAQGNHRVPAGSGRR
ncbi:hypothetical protein F5Y09DRAFT_172801 [Xylaria sp. FL1042]|nr:hypothetical protein F5Y09DRAFT_172801 [Xylaria sp. FL1042]